MVSMGGFISLFGEGLLYTKLQADVPKRRKRTIKLTLKTTFGLSLKASNPIIGEAESGRLL